MRTFLDPIEAIGIGNVDTDIEIDSEDNFFESVIPVSADDAGDSCVPEIEPFEGHIDVFS